MMFDISEETLMWFISGHFILAIALFLTEYFRKKANFNINSIFWIVTGFIFPYVVSILYFLGYFFRLGNKNAEM